MLTSHTYYFRAHPNATALALLFHGTGGNALQLIELGQELLPSANLLSIEGNVREQGMPRYFARHAEGVFDSESVNTEATSLEAFLADSLAAHNPNNLPVVAIGYSNGANMIGELLLRGKASIDMAILFRAMSVQEHKVAQSKHPAKVLILSGERDTMISPEKAKALHTNLNTIGHTAQQVSINASHGLTEADIEQVTAWLAENLLP